MYFKGSDCDPGTGRMCAPSVPVDAVCRHTDTILTYEMNDEPFPSDQEYQVRIGVTVAVAAPQEECIGDITMSDDKSEPHRHSKDYGSFRCNVEWKDVDFDAWTTTEEMPVLLRISSHNINPPFDTVGMSDYP